MFFRFGSALILVVVTSLLGIFVEKQNLTLRREISRQHYRMDVLHEEHTRLRLRSQQLAAVERLFETIEDENSGLVALEPGENSFRPSSIPSSQDHRSNDDEPPHDATAESANRHDDLPVSVESSKRDESQLTTRRVPLLFWQKPARDPRMKRGQR